MVGIFLLCPSKHILPHHPLKVVTILRESINSQLISNMYKIRWIDREPNKNMGGLEDFRALKNKIKNKK